MAAAAADVDDQTSMLALMLLMTMCLLTLRAYKKHTVFMIASLRCSKRYRADIEVGYFLAFSA